MSAFASTALAEQPRVVALIPTHELQIGDLVEIPVVIRSEEVEIVSYAIELKYDKSLLRFLDVGAGLTPEFFNPPMHNHGPATDSGLWVTGSASSFGENRPIINVATIRFELISEHDTPAFDLLPAGPLVRGDSFDPIEGIYIAGGELDLWNILLKQGFE